MTKRNDTGRGPVGLHAALGIGRLAAVIAQMSTSRRVLQAVQRFDPATRRSIAKTALMTVAAVLGFWGFQEAAPLGTPPEDPWKMAVIWKNIFRTLQLLTTQFPTNLPTELPLQLQIARFAMPIFAVWITASALFRRFNRPLLVWFAGLSREHVVLVGVSQITLALARAYRAMGRPVIAIVPPVAPNATSPMEYTGARVIFGEPSDLKALRRAAVHRAATLIAAEDVGTAAVTLASSVAIANASREQGRPSLTFLIRLASRELRTLMASQIATAMRQSNVDLRLYVRERTLARSLLARYPVDWALPPGPHDVHAAIIGLGDMGAELLLQLARIAVPTPGRRTVLTVIDRKANGLKEQLLLEYPGLAQCAELRFIEADLRPSALQASEAAEWFLQPVAANAIYVCCGDDHANLAMAIGLRRAYARLAVSSAPIFVHQRTGTTLIDALSRMHAAVFDTLRVVPFGSIEQEADPFFLVDEEIDDLARLIHEDYLRAARPGPAAVPWSELADTYRTANRSQADHVLAKLRGLGLHATGDKADAVAAIDPARLEELAVQEHDRWCRDRWLGGWSYGEQRDDAALKHPNLVSYEQLSEPLRDLDRQTVRGLPAMLGNLGVGLRRDLRVGVWFDDRSAAPSEALVQAVASKLGGRVGGADQPHLQLVLPLRVPAEFVLAIALAKTNGIGVDVALVRSASAVIDVGPTFDRDQARDLIAAADRAFTLQPVESPGLASDSAAFAAFCDVCDSVVLACDEAETVEALLRQVGEARRKRVDVAALRY